MPDDYARDAEVAYSIDIRAGRAVVWNALTDPACLKQWMLDTDLDVVSHWQVGSPIIFRGVLNGSRFENRGTIRACTTETVLEYDYWSTLSQSKVPDKPENYTTVCFELEETGDGTKLSVLLSGFADESIYRHVKFYWNGTLHVLKRFCEKNDASSA